MKSLPDIQATIWQVERLPGVEFLQAAYTRHEFPKHAHDSYVLQVVEQGINRCFCGKKTLTAPPNSVLVIHPGEVHTGWSVAGGYLRYRSFYIQPDFFRQFYPLDSAYPVFQRNILADPPLAHRMLQLHQASETTSEAFETQTLVYQMLSELLIRHAEKSQQSGRISQQESVRITKAKEYLHAHFSAKVSLDTLADVVALSPHYFLRVFRQQTGMSPYEYLLSLRIERARHLLKEKLPIVQVALETGFADQSHLTRFFKKLVGVTPGQYIGRV